MPHKNAMPQTQDMTSNTVTIYRHRADLSCYPSMWNVTLEYTTTGTHLNVLDQTQSGNPSATFPHTPANVQLYDTGMVVVSQKLGRKCTLCTESWTWVLWCANPLCYLLAHRCFLNTYTNRLFKTLFFIGYNCISRSGRSERWKIIYHLWCIVWFHVKTPDWYPENGWIRLWWSTCDGR